MPRAANRVADEQPFGERAAVVGAGGAEREHLVVRGARAARARRARARAAAPRRRGRLGGMPASRSGPVSFASCPPMRRRVAGRGARVTRGSLTRRATSVSISLYARAAGRGGGGGARGGHGRRRTSRARERRVGARLGLCSWFPGPRRPTAGGQLRFRLQPVIQLVAGNGAALQIKLVRRVSRWPPVGRPVCSVNFPWTWPVPIPPVTAKLTSVARPRKCTTARAQRYGYGRGPEHRCLRSDALPTGPGLCNMRPMSPLTPSRKDWTRGHRRRAAGHLPLWWLPGRWRGGRSRRRAELAKAGSHSVAGRRRRQAQGPVAARQEARGRGGRAEAASSPAGPPFYEKWQFWASPAGVVSAPSG